VVISKGRESFTTGHAINHNMAWSHDEQAQLELVAARWARKQGSSPVTALRAARHATDNALRLDPGRSSAWLASADIYVEEARLARSQDRETEALLRQAHNAAMRALEFNRKFAAAHLTLAAVAVEQALNAIDAPDYRAAAKRFETEIELTKALDRTLVERDEPELRRLLRR
jgi:hypothetical protein